MSYRDEIQTQMKEAMKAKDTIRLSTIRLIMAAIKDRDIAARTKDQCQGCGDEMILDILAKMRKQREESVDIYEKAARLDLAERERAEIAVIASFMPKQMSQDELQTAARDVVEELQAAGLKDMGRCMGLLKQRYAGRMDFGKAGAALKAILG
ncbi:Transamidase GatB domain protein [hydrothermal vent metagenome]|uniref:Transamidase GatB domain protein n=1 Tax=hydrothermal vent metagenome TaxID=652676 RepID=A0A3B0RHB9_9ZZZZ